MKRLLSLLLVLVTLVTCFPMAALNVSAEEAVEPVEEVILHEEVAATPAEEPVEATTMETLHVKGDPNFPDNEELFAGYADSVFYGTSAVYNKATGQLQATNGAVYANAAGNRLTGDVKKMYNALVPIIKQIAAGNRSSTTISIGQTVYYDGSYLYPDASASFTGYTFYESDFNLLIDALLADLPYEQYWFDKTIGVYASWFRTGGTLSYIEFSFTVAENYRGYDEFYVDTSKTSAATTSAANARKIVSSNKSKNDYQKLVAYKDAICSRVSYDFDAVYSGDFSVNNDPWQMIYAFDNDPSTNIVCEGYSKAFMYLCDQSDFRGNVTCYTVTGDAGGPHMWNIVSIGGKNYLVDITNSDSGSIGQNGGLFLAGGSGSPSGGYYFMNNRMYFDYDTDTTGLWGTGTSSILYLSSTDFTPPTELKITTQPKTVSVAIGETATVSVKATGDGLTYKWYFKNPTATSYSLSSTTGSTYSMKMTQGAAGRKVYCVVKDKYGNTVKSNVATLDQEARITAQPKTVDVAKGSTAKVTVKAVGAGLTYRWYFKNAGATKYSLSTKCTGSSYTATMSDAVAGRKVYCVVKDKYGNTVKSNVVTLDQKVRIAAQPKSVSVDLGATAKTTVKAVGTGLTYKWYFKNPTATKYSVSSITSSTYSMKMTQGAAGRKVYCVVTDKYGNTVKSNVATLNRN